jgi:DeoR family transcriptional regulator of aga operon
MEEAEITRQMMKSSRQSIMLCDSSKLGKKGFARICGMEGVDVLITDTGLPEKTKNDLEALGVKVVMV